MKEDEQKLFDLYASDGRKYQFSKDEEIGRGKYGVVYRFGDKAVKVLNNPDNALVRNVVSIIKRLNLKNYYKLFDILSSNRFIARNFAGTVSKYYPNEVLDISDMPMDYLLDNFYTLCKSHETLADNSILVNDLYSKNVILGNDEITVVDVDLYTKMFSVNTDNIKASNVYSLKTLFFRDLLRDHYLKFHRKEVAFSSEKFNRAIREIVIPDSNDIGSKENVGKILSKYKKPIDYVRRILK